MLYLARHGDAVSDTEDPSRPLSPRGRQEIASVARLAGRLGLEVDRVVHSGKLRARQTAEILAAALQPRPLIEEITGLDPTADPQEAAGYILAVGKPLMLVGHLPHLGRLTSHLLVDDPTQEVVAWPTGAVVALVQVDGRWRVRWLLTPEVAGALAPSV